MFWLPQLAVGASHWRLPLIESTATAMVAVLFSGADPATRGAFRDAVATDPALALWLVCKFPTEHIPRGSDEVAEWFLRDPAALLNWDAEVDHDVAAGDQPPPAGWLPDRWNALAERSRGAARGVAGHAIQAGCDSALIPSAELIALLHQAPELLALCGPIAGVPVTVGEPTCLPRWLVTAVNRLRQADSSEDAGDDMLRSVQRAIAAHQADALRSRGPASELSPPEPTIAQATLGPAAMLPKMVRTVARLAQLEGDFSTALESAKLDAMRELAYGASHEINNPLANISTRAQTLLIDETDPERRRKLATINSQAFRAHEMISDIMLFAKPPQLDPTPIELAELVAEVVAELADDAAEQGTELRTDFPDHPLTLLADRGHLAIALKALLRNSLEAVGLGGQVELTGRPVVAEGPRDSQVEIGVHDTGPGVSAEARESMFNPFYSGREAGRGLGLGLSKCWRIVTLHGGTIRLDDACSDGARFVICLPASTVDADGPVLVTHG